MSMTENAATKMCVKCKEDKELLAFDSDKSREDGLYPYCKVCRIPSTKQYYENNKEKVLSDTKKRYKKICKKKWFKEQRYNAHIKRTLGITIDEYNNLFIEQGGRCAICGIHQSKRKRRFAADHCHNSKKVRGLLCHYCNRGLGQFEDNVQILRNAVKYLEVS